MRQLVSAVLALLTSSPKTAVSDQRAGVDEATWLATNAAAALTSTLRAAGLDAREHGVTVAVSGHIVGVSVHVENRLQRQGQHVLAARFEIAVDGMRIPNLVAGAIGMGNDPTAALATAGTEWVAQYGVPIGFALAAQLGDGEAAVPSNALAPFHRRVEVDGQLLFHGPPGVRGQAKQAAAISSDDFVRGIARHVVGTLRQQQPVGAYRSALVQVVITGTAVTSGECRLDGVISTELFEVLSRLSWPEAAPTYMLKVFFVGPARGKS